MLRYHYEFKWLCDTSVLWIVLLSHSRSARQCLMTDATLDQDWIDWKQLCMYGQRPLSCHCRQQNWILSNHQIPPICCMLMHFLMIFVHYIPGIRHFVLDFFVLINEHRIYGRKEHRMLPFLDVFPSWYQSRPWWWSVSHGIFQRNRCARRSRSPTRWPWIVRRYWKVSSEQGSTQYWNLFLIPHPLCKKLRRVRIDQCEEDIILDRKWCQIFEFYCSVIFSIYWIIMSQQSDHQFHYLQTTFVQSSWFCVYPLSLTIRNRHGKQRQGRCWSWPSLRNKLPCTPLINTFSENLSWRFCYVFVYSSLNQTQEQILSPNGDSIMISHPELDRSSCFHIFILSLSDDWSLRRKVYSRHDPFSLKLIVIKRGEVLSLFNRLRKTSIGT